ncbi:MAG TPA: NAD(P)H-dependent glycerol-3-phosphate dehydrogenase [Candidatus Babeliales bacterium]|nr:NAD(P)H-dependent glycerol-3-phosphate dehydrogenase [Candidatus Babeliales bacterium]
MNDKKKVCVLGDGAWGTAVATLLATNGHEVTLWCYEPEVAQTIISTGYNKKYLPGIQLPSTIRATSNIDEAVCGADFVFEAVPVKFLRTVINSTKQCYSPDQIWVILSKGIEQETLQLPTEIIDDIFGYETRKAVFSGPSYAQDVVKQQVTAVVIAASDCAIAHEVQKLVVNDYFRPYASDDIIGVQIGAAIKNVIALGIGILEGAGFTDNTKAFLFTRSLQEMVILSQTMGGKKETVYGLSGLGDLVLTAMGSLSKNNALGCRIGRGETLDTLKKEFGTIPEGINTLQALEQLMDKYNLDLPICSGIYAIIFEQKPVIKMITELMAKPLDQECKL